MSTIQIPDGVTPPALSLNPASMTDADRISPIELAELIRAFNEVTARLQGTHETLTAEVARLKGELRDANQQLRRARELAALGEMAAGIAHEVRNPLGSIRLYASAMEEDLTDRPEQRLMARKIADAVHGLNAVVSDVLAFARELRIDPEEIEVSELIDRSLACCEDLIQQGGVQIDAFEGDASGAVLMCDSALTQQALANVLRNAIEAATNGEQSPAVRIDVTECQVRSNAGRAKPMVSIRVHDSGAGVSDDVMARMFNPFFTTRHAGTGLGLAIVHRIVDAHGGRVTVRNHEEGGAVVEIMIPAATQRRNAPAVAHSAHGGDA